MSDDDVVEVPLDVVVVVDDTRSAKWYARVRQPGKLPVIKKINLLKERLF